MISPFTNLNDFTLLLCSTLVWLQLPPFALTMYAPWPIELKLNPQFLAATTLGWHIPTATQFESDSLILNVNFLTEVPLSRCGSMMTNLQPELFADLTRYSERSLISGCLRVDENLKSAPCFQTASLLKLSFRHLRYFYSFLLTSSMLVSNCFLMSSLFVLRETIISASVSTPSSFFTTNSPDILFTAFKQSSSFATVAWMVQNAF